MITHASTHFLARYQAGDLSERRSAAVTRHLSTCTRCSRLSEALSAVPAALASVQAPPMPGIALARISDALAAEATLRAERSMTADGAEREDAQGGRPADARPRPGKAAPRVAGSWRPFRMPKLRPLSGPVALRVASVAAAAAVLAGGGYGWYQLTTTPGPLTAASGGGHPAQAPRAAPHVKMAAPAGGPATVYYRRDGHLASAPVFSTGTNFRRGTLGRDVRRSLAGQAGFGFGNVTFGPAQSAAPSGRSPEFRGPIGGVQTASLPGCISRIAAGRRVIAADIGRYQGRPATVIALAVPHSAVADVWVVGAGCSASRSDVLARTSVRI